MNRTDIINELARRTKITYFSMTRAEVEHILDLFIALMKEELTKPTGQIRFEDFGILEVDRRIKRHGSSGQLRQGATDTTANASRISYHLRFKPSAALKKQLKANIVRLKYTE